MMFSEEAGVCFMNTLPIVETYLAIAAASPAAMSRPARARREAVVTAGSRRAEVGGRLLLGASAPGHQLRSGFAAREHGHACSARLASSIDAL